VKLSQLLTAPLTRTPDLYRVNFEVNNPKPFPYLAFPQLVGQRIPQKRASFDGELMASLSFPTSLRPFLISGAIAILRQFTVLANGPENLLL
jgi:hypothetical protein